MIRRTKGSPLHRGAKEINIFGGVVRAYGNRCGAGIGGAMSGCDYTVNLYGGNIYAEKGYLALEDIGDGQYNDGNGTVNDYRGTGSTLSGGSLWIIVAVAVVVLGTVAGLVVVNKKKKSAQAAQ